MANDNLAAEKSRLPFDISSAVLHIIAMISMLIDHVCKFAIDSGSPIVILGRLAFPIFAFMAANGYFHTHSFRKYLFRMAVFAVISEVPYDLMKSGEFFDIYDQNVLWTFLIALIAMGAMDAVKTKWGRKISIPASVIISLAAFIAGSVFFTDYGGMGVLTVLVFYFCRKRDLPSMLIQLAAMVLINVFMLGALNPTIEILSAEFPVQGFAVLSLIPIWLYRGRQGHHSKPFQYACYAFYPVHMAVIALIAAF